MKGIIEIVGGRFDGETIRDLKPNGPNATTVRVLQQPAGLVFCLLDPLEAVALDQFPCPGADYLLGADGKARLVSEHRGKEATP